ncbi:hypothetical protein CC80DRAFT_499043 [Byssothecium circinans]|uniref:Uncharacterized protein n=1 Tax=Byssothecium circinans TaxID=147558 RepID=A0A6A5UC09_9PLEO|nr:hypothetical protein CC80DRAFT_499043 [Byssothecium circinans]
MLSILLYSSLRPSSLAVNPIPKLVSSENVTSDGAPGGLYVCSEPGFRVVAIGILLSRLLHHGAPPYRTLSQNSDPGDLIMVERASFTRGLAFEPHGDMEKMI